MKLQMRITRVLEDGPDSYGLIIGQRQADRSFQDAIDGTTAVRVHRFVPIRGNEIR